MSLLPPDERARVGWRVSWKDPDTGKQRRQTIPAGRSKTADGRAAYAREVAREVSGRQVDLGRGAHRRTGTLLSTAVDLYFEDATQLRESTRAIYDQHAVAFLAWAELEGISTGDELTRASLLRFRASRGKMGRSPWTTNVELRTLRTILGYVRSLGLTAGLTDEDLRIGLKQLAVPKPAKRYLSPAEIADLLRACLAHDAETWDLTREEKEAGFLPGEGKTPKHLPISGVIAMLLLTGMRSVSECLALTWEQVELDSKDDFGQLAPSLLLGVETKTATARRVELFLCPVLAKLLRALKGAGQPAGLVFEGHSKQTLKRAVARLEADYGAPAFRPKDLRSTAATYAHRHVLADPGYLTATFGHSAETAQRHYVGGLRGRARGVATLEAAMGAAALFEKIVRATKARDE